MTETDRRNFYDPFSYLKLLEYIRVMRIWRVDNRRVNFQSKLNAELKFLTPIFGGGNRAPKKICLLWNYSAFIVTRYRNKDSNYIILELCFLYKKWKSTIFILHLIHLGN